MPAGEGAAATSEPPSRRRPSEEGTPAPTRPPAAITGPGEPEGAPIGGEEGRTSAMGPSTAGGPVGASGREPTAAGPAGAGPAAVAAGEVAPRGTSKKQDESGGAECEPSGGSLVATPDDKGAGAAAAGAASPAGLEGAPWANATVPAGGRAASQGPREADARGAAAPGRSRGSSVRSIRSGRADRSTASRAGGSVGDEQHSGGAHALHTGQGMMTSPEARRAWTMQTR